VVLLELANSTISAEAKAVHHRFGTQAVNSGALEIICT
jgi:hypothetical protein